ncbi:MAG: hypothetical protein MMC33_001228 [Icmadophila ericetorum]|nr:hypothetical protein [Icmadophila ericetorum]
MTLCSNRPEGFGPISHLYTHILTSCFLDTILIPLISWLYYTTLLLLLIFRSRLPPSTSFKNRHITTTTTPLTTDSNIESSGSGSKGRIAKLQNRTLPQRILFILYHLLLLALLLMNILEITRLSLAHLGIGLLPFIFPSLLIAGALHHTYGFRDRVRGWRWANVGLWVGLIVVELVKLAEEGKEGVGTRKGTKYPESDEIIDVGVMVGCYVVVAVLEVLSR